MKCGYNIHRGDYMEKEIKLFIKSNRLLTRWLLVSIALVISYEFAKGMPELFPHGDFVYNFFVQLGLAYIASFIFYIFQVYLPEVKNKRIVDSYVIEKMKLIVRDHFIEIEQLIQGTNCKCDKENIEQEDFSYIFKKIAPYSDSGVYIGVQNMSQEIQANWSTLLQQKISLHRVNIDKIISHIPLVDIEVIKLMHQLECSDYFSHENFIKEAHAWRLDNFEILADMYYEYHCIIKRIKAYFEQ